MARIVFVRTLPVRNTTDPESTMSIPMYQASAPVSIRMLRKLCAILDFLQGFAMNHYHFHTATAHALPRLQRVDIGELDFPGQAG